VTQDPTNPASAAGAARSGKHHKRLASDFFGNRLSARDIQAQNLVRPDRARLLRLRLVPPAPPPRPHHLQIQISVSDGRAPLGRTRPLRLTEADLAWLVEAAVRLEAGAP
jgi:hypothetical protein